MLTRKQGPPIPPRPNASVDTKTNRDDSQVLNGRTVIYKSPSIDLLDKLQLETKNYSTSSTEITHAENISVTSIMSTASATTTTVTDAKHVTKSINNNNSFNNNNNNNKNNKNNNVRSSSVINVNINENSYPPPVASKSPIPRPRLLKPAPTYQLPVVIPPSTNLPSVPVTTTTTISSKVNNSNYGRLKTSNLSRSQITITSVSNESYNNMETSLTSKGLQQIDKFNLNQRTEPDGGETSCFNHDTTKTSSSSSSSSKTSSMKASVKPPVHEKKVAFHELLISELAAMRNNSKMDNRSNINTQSTKSISVVETTTSSPFDTYKSKIRTSDWVEVGDNGREMVLSSCQISLEDSGLEDEERFDDMSSGNCNSWDPIKHSENRYVPKYMFSIYVIHPELVTMFLIRPLWRTIKVPYLYINQINLHLRIFLSS